MTRGLCTQSPCPSLNVATTYRTPAICLAQSRFTREQLLKGMAAALPEWRSCSALRTSDVSKRTELVGDGVRNHQSVWPQSMKPPPWSLATAVCKVHPSPSGAPGRGCSEASCIWPDSEMLSQDPTCAPHTGAETNYPTTGGPCFKQTKYTKSRLGEI